MQADMVFNKTCKAHKKGITMKAKPKNLRMGQTIELVYEPVTIISAADFVRGGVRFLVRRENGTEETVILNGRMNYEVIA